MATYRSRRFRNTVREFLAAAGIGVEQAAAFTGLDASLLQAFADDPRLMPDLQIAMRFMASTGGADAAALLVADPLPDDAAPLPVVVVGAGNLGHVFTGLLGARADIDLRLLLSSAERAAEFRAALQQPGGVTVQLTDGSSITGAPRVVTHNAAEAVPGARVVLLCVPSHVEVAALDRVLPWLDRSDACVGSIPAPGGFDWKARAALQRHGRQAAVFGLGYIPWMCKTTAFGSAARLLGGKPVNVVGVLPPQRLGEVADLLAQVLRTPVLDLGSFLNMTLHAGNQVLHPAIIYSMFRDWDGHPLPEPPLFYEGVTPEAAALCQQLGDEIQLLKQALLQALPQLQLPLVLPLHESLLHGYGAAIADPATLHSSIASNRAYAGIRTPLRQVEAGWVPDWNSRFFLEDIPHGLVVLRGLADLAGVQLPLVDQILYWAQRNMGRVYLVDGELSGPAMAESGAPQVQGIGSVAELAADQLLP